MREKLMEKFHKIKTYIQKNPKQAGLVAVGGVGTIAGVFAILWLFFPHIVSRPSLGANSAETEVQQTYYSPLTGEKVSKEESKRIIKAVMIENSPQARPQAGLDQAGAVLEAVAEGGITRFMALYQASKPNLIGPVRSLRPYFLDWGMGFDAPIAHVGGSAEALSLVRSRGAKDLDQFTAGQYFYRSGDRFAPHNMYTRMSLLDDFAKSRGYTKTNFEPYPHKPDTPVETPEAKRISLQYSSSQYNVEFRYRKENNNYARFMAGQKHIDAATNQQIMVKNLIVIRMPTSQSGQYAVMQTIGTGRALLFRDGEVIKGKWRKKSPRKKLELLNQDGSEMQLNRGSMWFAIVPVGNSVSY